MIKKLLKRILKINKITSIKYDQKDISQVIIYIDNKTKYKLSHNLFKLLNLCTDKELSVQEIEKIILENKIIKMKEYALRLLSRRIYSKYEISTKLKIKGYTENIISEVIFWLENKKYINDELFATMWAQFRFKNKFIGRYKLNQELKIKGVNQEIIQKVINMTYNQIDELALARNLIDEKYYFAKLKNVTLTPYKIYNFLLRRGFSREISKNISDELNNPPI